MQPTRKGRMLTLIFGSALVITLGTAVLYQGTLAKTYRRQLEYAYQEALGQLAESTAAIAVDLEKACYAGSEPSVWETSARLWRECGTAKAALSALPLENEGLSGTAGFLSQVGDYAMALARSGKASDRSQLADLLPYAQKLAQQTDLLESSVLSGEIPAYGLALGYLEGTQSAEENKAIATSAPVEQPQNQEPSGSAGESSFAAMEEGFASLPRLIYDGPFSTHLQDRSPQMLTNLPHLSRDRAKAAAADLLGGQPEEAGDENSSIPSYLFTLGEKTAAITKQGGFVLWMTDGTPVEGQNISLSQAKQAARTKLEELGYPDMESSYHEVAGNVAIFNFAAFQNGVVCYTDLIKIGVALDSGRVVQLDARGYLMNHHTRTLPAVTLAQEEASRLLSPALTATSSRLALIPSAGEQERLCHEFLCRGLDDRHVLVYLNASTGAEEDILLLEMDENGTLTV